MTLIEDLKNIVGRNGWVTDPKELEPHLSDWRGAVVGSTPIMVAPKNTGEVAAVIGACGAANVSIVPQGGNTGMCAGAVPDDSGTQVILSLSRMNKIREIDTENYSMQVEAGCILQNVQEAAKEADRYFPLSLGAEGSCQIGGNLSTNAGGINVVRYGTARALVLGLEVVLADGTVVSGLRSLRKDTAGYDLKQLFIGSEGTLGVITAATLKLYPDPGETATALVALKTSGDAVRLLAQLRRALTDVIEAFELISQHLLDLVEKHIPDATLPFDQRYRWYVLIEAATGSRPGLLEEELANVADSGMILDAIIAKNNAEAKRLWELRHSIPEAERLEGKALKHDISLPISQLESFLARGDELLARLVPDGRLLAFGHVGDGNLHYNVALPEGFADGRRISEAIYELVVEFGGSFSAEHGIGQLKRPYLPRYRSDSEMQLMRTLKKALDPRNILNPGKVI